MNYNIQKITLLVLIIVQLSCAQNEGSNIAKWTKLPTNSPSMRSENAMAYDEFHKKIIIYGGRSGFPDFKDINETWAFDYPSKTWTNLKPEKSPPWRTSQSMVYDTLRHKVIMFGGGDFEKVYNDLWEYDYQQNTWAEIQSLNPPEARQMNGMVYIQDRDIVITFGGRRLNGGASFADTWEFNFKTKIWRKLNSKQNPPVSDHVNMTYDQSAKKIILFTNSQTWAFDLITQNWENLNISNYPNNDHSHLVYGEHLKKSILFGNADGSTRMITWLFDFSDKHWTDISSNDFPKINFSEHKIIEHDALVYLNNLNVFIQYGGCCSEQTLELDLGK